MAGIAHPNILSFVLLGLVRSQPMYGYEMHHELEQQTALGLIWHVKQPHLYALLSKLEDEGLLWGESESHGTRPPRRILRVTPRGAAAFDHWLATPVRYGRDFRQEFLAQLYFAQRAGDDALAHLIARQAEACMTRRDALRADLARLPADRPFDRLVYDFRLRQMETILEWLKICQATLLAAAKLPSGSAPLAALVQVNDDEAAEDRPKEA